MMSGCPDELAFGGGAVLLLLVMEMFRVPENRMLLVFSSGHCVKSTEGLSN